jgi:hypothetical protein
MKPLYMLALGPIMLLSLLMNPDKERIPSPESKALEMGPYIKIHLEMGRKKYDCLKGFGICRLTIQVGYENNGPLPLNDDEIGGELRKTTDNRLELTVPKGSGMNAETEQKYFLSGTFRMEEGFSMPQDITEELELGEYYIPPGQYRVREESSQYVVVF